MRKENIKNWKLVEVIDDIIIIDDKSQDYVKRMLKELEIPTTNHTTTNRAHTEIDWLKIDNYHKFSFEDESEEKIIGEAFQNSKLSEKKNIIISYGWNEPPIKISTQKFIEDWEEFIRSTIWETIMFSEDFELIMEVSRDYNIHSNFRIR